MRSAGVGATRVSAGVLGLALVVALGGRASAQTETVPPPYQLVRTLQLMQDQVAYGNVEAHAAQLTVLKHVSEKLLAADPEVWKEPRNTRAVVLFLLSGGSPEIVRSLLARGVLSNDDKLLAGSLAYVEGREKEALDLLGPFQPRALPAALGGHVALVQSALLVRSDPRAAIERLDDARLLMPGTLVDEAALRREIFVAGQVDDFDKFEVLATQYMRRYRHSVYAGNFRQRFALALTRFSFAQETRRFPRLVAMLEHLDTVSRRTLYLLVARTAVVRGKTEMAELAAEQAAALSPSDSAERQRAQLYRASALVVTAAYEQGVSELKAIDRARLPERDAELLDAALTLSRNLRKAPPPPPVSEPPAQKNAGGWTRPSARLDLSASTATLDQARRLIGEMDVLLKEETQ